MTQKSDALLGDIRLSTSASITKCPDQDEFYDTEGRPVPIPLIQEAIAFPAFGSKLSRALKIAFIAGPRLSEIGKMKRSLIVDEVQHWKCGKNQKGKPRHEYFPPNLIAEIDYGMQRDRHRDDLICDLSGSAISHYFNRFVRPYLSAAWREKVPVVHYDNGELVVDEEYRYQLKGFRKTFATLLFTYYCKLYDNDDTAATETAKRMRHTDKWMSKAHYIKMSYSLDAEKYVHLMPFEFLTKDNQEPLAIYMHVPSHLMDYNCTGRPLRQFDRKKALKMMQKRTVLDVSRVMGVPRTTLYRLRDDCPQPRRSE